ncbi:DUF4232 domain-containing protein [Streptomyces sp. AF1A]|jgi:hypothetical protein|uniref:DUF4232 domain-containing protein n=1 Tax=Streptomyces sp. AF1A TaxID=3394350 RepID=UPI0039BD9334
MRVHKLSLLAVAVVAGLSLTACQGSGDDKAAGPTGSSTPGSGSRQPASASPGTGGGNASAGASTGTGHSGAGGASAAGGASGACKTSQLAFGTSGGMAEGTLIVNLKNTGPATCTLKGFPGADLKSKDGTVSAGRSRLAAPLAALKPGEETRFTLHYPPNNSGGSGETFTSLVVTPPGETHSHTLPVRITVPVTDGSGTAITVDPVGTGK